MKNFKNRSSVQKLEHKPILFAQKIANSIKEPWKKNANFLKVSGEKIPTNYVIHKESPQKDEFRQRIALMQIFSKNRGKKHDFCQRIAENANFVKGSGKKTQISSRDRNKYKFLQRVVEKM